MRRLLWLSVGVIATAQAAFGLVTLVWPPEAGIEALITRLQIWQAAPVWGLQLFLAVPVLVTLIWQCRARLARGLLLLCLALTLALPALLIVETAVLHQVALDTMSLHRDLRLLSLARWADAGLGLAALIALRLAARAEALA